MSKCKIMVPGPRVELGTPASSGQRSTDELARRYGTRIEDFFAEVKNQKLRFGGVFDIFLTWVPAFAGTTKSK